MNLQSYLDRICYHGPLQVNIETMTQIHSHHLLHIPYENVDVQLRRPVSLEIGPIFDKIVNQHRGGWCYEMNGLLAWALQEIGFTVPLVVRLDGTNVEEARRILDEARSEIPTMQTATDLADAAQKVCAAVAVPA